MALSKVTDEFIAHIKAKGPEWDLGQATEFLVVAATLLDLKAARLLPSGEVEDEEDLALLEARDLLFARLLQYRAYKQVAAFFAGRMADEAGRLPAVGVAGAAPRRPAAGGAARPRPAGVRPAGREGARAEAGADGLGRPPARAAGQRARAGRASSSTAPAARRAASTFRALIADCEGTLLVVARFLALLELYREGAVTFEQVDPLGELHIRWTGTDEGEIEVPDEFEDDAEARAEDDSSTEGRLADRRPDTDRHRRRRGVRRHHDRPERDAQR